MGFWLYGDEHTYADVLLAQAGVELNPYYTKAALITERRVEVSLGHTWLNSVSSPWEVGAVMPYYFPDLCGVVIDPGDESPLVTLKNSLFDLDFKGQNVLSISTIEHVGTGQYGLSKEGGNAVDAYKKITDEADKFLITAPIGQNKTLDRFLLHELESPYLQFMVRLPERDNEWVSVPKEQAAVPNRGKGRGSGAVAVIERGVFNEDSRHPASEG